MRRRCNATSGITATRRNLAAALPITLCSPNGWNWAGAYPKAKQALLNIRDNNTREITEGRGYADMFLEVRAINRELQDDDATYALFKTVRDSDPKLADQCFYYLQDLLVAKGEYQWCLKHLGDPQERFNSIRQRLDMDRDNQKRMAETMSTEPRNEWRK